MGIESFFFNHLEEVLVDADKRNESSLGKSSMPQEFYAGGRENEVDSIDWWLSNYYDIVGNGWCTWLLEIHWVIYSVSGDANSLKEW